MEPFPTCEPCLQGKMTKKPFPKANRSTELLAIIHSDLCGPFNVRTLDGYEYFMTFIDDYSRPGQTQAKEVCI